MRRNGRIDHRRRRHDPFGCRGVPGRFPRTVRRGGSRNRESQAYRSHLRCRGRMPRACGSRARASVFALAQSGCDRRHLCAGARRGARRGRLLRQGPCLGIRGSSRRGQPSRRPSVRQQDRRSRDRSADGRFARERRAHDARAREGLGKLRNARLHDRRCGGGSVRQGFQGARPRVSGRPYHQQIRSERQSTRHRFPPRAHAFGRSALQPVRPEDRGHHLYP